MKDLLHVRIESPALPSALVEIHTLLGREAISQLFEFELLTIVRGTTELDEEALLTSPAALVFERGGNEVARMFGMISSVKDSLHTETPHLAYTLKFVPRAWRASLTETSEIFMDQTVGEIVTEKLSRGGLEFGEDFELRLNATYPPLEFVVQYKETDIAFLSRLTEHHGISFFFEHRDGKDVLVLTDDNSGFRPVAGDALPFSPRGETLGVFGLEKTTRSLPKRYVVKDYNYRTPQVALLATAPVSSAGGDVIEYGAHFKTPGEGSRIAQIRAEELLVGRTVFDGKSDVQTLRAGVRFKLDGHSRADGAYLLMEVRHSASQPTLGTGMGTEATYQNTFVAIPAQTTFRPARVTPKPRVHGVISGTIESEEKGQYADVDAQGRYRVRFQFDTGDAHHGKASRPIRMAQPHAGPGYGFHFPLRDGIEVLLTCVDGDPDRPIISGAVPNPVTPSTVADGNGKRNVIRTGVGNEINMDDTEGSSRIKLSVPYANTVLQLGAPEHPGKGALLTTGENVTISAGGFITQDAKTKFDLHAGTFMTFKADTELMGLSPKITFIAGAEFYAYAPTVDVVGDDTTARGTAMLHLLAGNAANMEAPWVDINAGTKLRAGSPNVEINGTATIIVTCGASITIKGGGEVKIEGNPVTIKGSVVNVTGGPINLNC